jgi:magnesium transporter
MPELEYENGYYAVIAVLFLIVIGMIFYFKKRRWF